MRIDKEIITSRQNRDIVEAAKLSDKRAREESELFKLDGIKLAREAAEKGVQIERVFLREDVVSRALRELSALPEDTRATVVSKSVFEKLSDEKSPEGIICIAKHLDNLKKIVKINKGDSAFSGDRRLFFAESIRDPGNLGTLIRSANALGCEMMMISADCADLYNPRTVRAAMGALFCLDIVIVENTAEAISALRANGRRVFAAALDKNAQKLGSFELRKNDCFIVGNEGHGLTREAIEACTGSVFIPMKEGAESLNAAAAAAVILWEQARAYF